MNNKASQNSMVNELVEFKNLMNDPEENQVSWLRRLLWFLCLWAGSVMALGLVTYGLKAFFTHLYS